MFSAQLSLADSVKIFNNVSAFLPISPNDGSGGNMAFNFSGPDLSLKGVGGTGCQ